jgi:hypothetical protein
MKRIVGLTIAFLLWTGAAGSTFAAESRVQVYIFGSAECSFCQNALVFLRKISRDNGGFDLHEYDVVRSSEDATLFVRFMTAVGMREAHIPMVVVGRDIILGYDVDATSGRELQIKIEACRIDKCTDVMGLFIKGGGPAQVVANATWTENRRWAAASERKSKQMLTNAGSIRP